MFKSQCSHMGLQKSILSHVTTLTFVVTFDYIDFFLENVTVKHNVHTFTIIVHGYLFHSFLIKRLRLGKTTGLPGTTYSRQQTCPILVTKNCVPYWDQQTFRKIREISVDFMSPIVVSTNFFSVLY